MNKIVVTAILFTICWPSFGQTVSSVSGSITDGESITISGLSFGSNGPTVSIFADFEEASNGDNLTTGPGSANFGEWDHALQESGNNTYSNIASVSGSLSARFDNTPYSGYNYLGDEYPDTNREILVSWWLYLPSNNYYPGESGGTINWKQIWVAGTGTNDDDLVIPVQLTTTWLVNGNDPDPGYSNYTTIGFTKGRWSRVTVWMKGGTNSTSNDGNFHLWYLNEDHDMTHQESDDTANILKESGAWERMRINAYAYSSDPCYPHFDDVYVAYGDYARARVEIGDASTYTSCRNMTILRPTAWSTTEITAVVNQGSFAEDDAAYLFVVDSDGNVSDGYAVTIGASESASITAPTSLTATKVE